MPNEKKETPAAFTPVIKRKVTFTLLKLVIDEASYVKVIKPMWVGKEVQAAEGKKKMEPAHLCLVINLITGEECEMIVNAVLQSIFNKEYPDDKYVGLCFQLVKGAKASGKGYNPFSVAEIEDPTKKP